MSFVVPIMYSENVLFSFGKIWKEGLVKIHSNGDVFYQNKTKWKKKFNILKGIEQMVVGVDAYFIPNCPILRANYADDVNKMIYIPNTKKKRNGIWIHFLNCTQLSNWIQYIESITVIN